MQASVIGNPKVYNYAVNLQIQLVIQPDKHVEAAQCINMHKYANTGQDL